MTWGLGADPSSMQLKGVLREAMSRLWSPCTISQTVGSPVHIMWTFVGLSYYRSMMALHCGASTASCVVCTHKTLSWRVGVSVGCCTVSVAGSRCVAGKGGTAHCMC